MQSNPLPAATNKLTTFPSWLWTKTDPNKGSQRERATRSCPYPILEPRSNSAIGRVHSNKVPVVIDRQEVIALIDLGAQVSSISTQFCKDLTLPIQPLGWLLELEGTGGAAIPYLGFVEVNLQIPGIRNYNEDVLLLVIPTMTYSKMVPIVVGSKIINKALSLMTAGELAVATMTWRQDSLWGSHDGVIAATIPKWLRQEQDERGSKLLPSKEWLCGGAKVPTRWCQRFGSHHTEGHYSTI